jgi:hypothetical protein
MNLIPDARQWHRLWSMRLMIITTLYTTAAGAWATVPDAWKPELTHVEQLILAGIGIALPALAAASRLVQQSDLQPDIPHPTVPSARVDDPASSPPTSQP